MCCSEVNRALRAAGRPCEVSDRVANIKTKTFVSITCFGPGQTLQTVSNGLIENVDASLASVIRVGVDAKVYSARKYANAPLAR